MVVCRYYQQGNCRNGDNCRFEHPGAQSSRSTGFASQNRFSAFQGPVGGSGSGSHVRKDAPWSINIADVKADFTPGKGRPEWILSSYGPGKNSPASLLDGNELSFEELRLRFCELKAEGNEMKASNEASGLWLKAEQAMSDTLNNSDKVVPFMEEAEKKHPNRYDFLKMTGKISKQQVVKEAGSINPFCGTLGAKPSGFAAPTTSGLGAGFGSTGTSGFGSDASKVSDASTGAFGQSTSSSGFGAPSFGQPVQPAFVQSAFGQPSATSVFGKPGGGAFGQPSSLGQPSQPSGFGTSRFSQPATKNPFAAPSAATFSQPSKTVSGFGQTSQPTSDFGQLSQPGAFGQPSQPSSGFKWASNLGGGFGQPSKPTTSFGQPSQPSSSFGQASQPSSGFGHASQPQPASSFAQPSNPFTAFPQPSQTAAGFGKAAQPAPAFGQPTQPIPAFGQLSQPASAFGQPSQPASGFVQPVPGFVQPAQSKTANQAVPALGQPLASEPTDRKPSNPFSSTNTANNPFGQPTRQASGSTTTNTSNPFVTTPSESSTAPTIVDTPPLSDTVPQSTHTASSTTPHPLTSKAPAPIHYTQTLPPGITQSAPRPVYKSRPVKKIHDAPCYDRPDRKGWERIWFPAGVENVRLEDVQLGEEAYTEEVKEVHRYLAETGCLETGNMPVVPPRREWVALDF